MLTYGHALDRFALRLDHRSRRQLKAPMTPEELWAALVPGAAPVDAHWDPLLVRVSPDPEDPNRRAVTYNHGSSFFQHQTQTVLAEDFPNHMRDAYEGDVSEANSALTQGTLDITIAEDPKGGSRVTLSERTTAMLPRTALQSWFDDNLGDMADHVRARFTDRRDWSLTGRYRRRVARRT